ncbi:gamma-glutamylcyclotransferase family protein [Paeniroseomonas aquatica]|uniref:Gamma-glutamylcyclotransferase family protein n=1 Tax=Paeniroseomonas aquatica TaxID=373043 RepID=A0ABT8A2E2_9PROT|nr:gamma-glutamylcyclotransferase family protein [Paeniroseomonas aquatica]MDN3563816.1 gamma-glutamylcyclotransferase family protein [Paeniroseomonas aquatica]
MSDLYAAYGSNLSRAQMRLRCPGATVAGSFLLPGWRLVLRRFARLEADPAGCCPVGLWRITPRHLAALDRAEGAPLIYRRSLAETPCGPAWIYHEVVDRPGPPTAAYVARIRAGYAEFGLDPAPLLAAIAEASAD